MEALRQIIHEVIGLRHVIEFGYGLFFFTGTVVSYYCIRLYQHSDLSELAKSYIVTWLIFFFIVSVRVGWFTVSRYFPTEGNSCNTFYGPQNEWMWSNKWAMSLFTGFIFLYAGIRFLNTMSILSKRHLAVLTVGILTASFIVALT